VEKINKGENKKMNIKTKNKYLLLMSMLMLMSTIALLFTFNNNNKMKVGATEIENIDSSLLSKNTVSFIGVSNNLNDDVLRIVFNYYDSSNNVYFNKNDFVNAFGYTNSLIDYNFYFENETTAINTSIVLIDNKEYICLLTKSVGLVAQGHYSGVINYDNSTVPNTEGYYNCTFNYLTVYKNTPFMEKQLKYKYCKINTNDDILNIIGLENLDLTVNGGKVIKFKKWNIKNNSNEYTYTAEYENQFFRTIDYNGNVVDWNLPLVSFSDYLSTIQINFEITSLNTDDNKWFNSKDEIKKGNLYGYFFTATFKGKMIDLNNFFKETTYDGAIIYYSYEYIKLNNFWNKTSDVLWYTLSPLSPTIDILNALFSPKYSCYCLYLDNTSDKAYIAENGAVDYNDTDSAIVNWWEKTKEKLFSNKDENKDYTTYIIIGIVIIIVLIAVSKKRKKNN
jgi:hypothetical protein